MLLLVLTIRAHALDPDKAITQYMFSSWDSHQGLPQNSVRTLTQGPHGYLWVGTYEGVALFDGLSFRRFVPRRGPVFQKTINGLLADVDGTVWVATEGGGLYAVSPQADVVQWQRGAGLPANQVTALAVDAAGTLWFGVKGHVFRMHAGTPAAIQGMPALVGRIRTMLVTDSGVLWIGTTGGGLYSWQQGRLRHWTEDDGFGATRVTSVIGDGGDGLWVGTFRGVWHFSGGRFERLQRDSDRVARIQNLWLEGNGSLWVGTYGSGLERWRESRSAVFSSVEGLRNDFVQSILMDRQGNLWFGTSEGLNRFREGSVLTWSSSEGLSGRFVRSVASDRGGDIWVGSDGGGLNRIHRGRVDLRLGTKDGLLSDTIRSLLPDGAGGLWIGAFAGGVNHWTRGKIQPGGLPGGPPSILVRALYQDQDGVLWVGTNDAGVGRYQGQQRQLFNQDTGLPVNDVRAITEFSGHQWLGTFGAGVVELDHGRVLADYRAADGIPSDGVLTFFTDSPRRLWVGTTEGLGVYENGSWRSVASKAIPRSVFQILQDHHGMFWLCTNAGIIRVDPRTLLAAEPGAAVLAGLRAFDELDGMRSAQCNGATQPVATVDARGRLWFPTLDGVAMIDPEQIVVRDSAPRIRVEALHSGAEEHASLGEEVLELRAGTRDVELRYNALDLYLPERIRFRYRLLGLSKAWIDAGSRRQAFFTNLPPGTFEFQVTAANGDGVWSQSPAQVHFSIAPYFYQTRWFGLLLAILATLLLYAAYQWRVRRFRRTRRALERRVDERTQAVQKANAALEDTLSELRASQEQLVQSQKLAAMGKLVAGVAHQLNTPIGNCTTVGTLLRDEYLQLKAGMAAGGVSRSRFTRFIDTANTGFELLCGNIAIAGRLVGKFRKLSVDDYNRGREQFELGSVLTELSGMFAARIRQAGHDLQVSCPDDLWVTGSRKALAEVFEQLVENTLVHAFDAPGGSVALTVSTELDIAVLRFRDNGAGMPAQRLQKVFEPFSGGVHGSGGLGLSIVHNLVTSIMGGTVSCEAVDGGGVCFVIRLPCDGAALHVHSEQV